MRKFIAIIVVLLLAVSPAWGFLYQMEVLNASQIKQLSDNALQEMYIDALVEVEASYTFHQTSGFKPSDFEKYKKLLKFRLLLLQEIKKRELEATDPQGTGPSKDLENPDLKTKGENS